MLREKNVLWNLRQVGLKFYRFVVMEVMEDGDGEKIGLSKTYLFWNHVIHTFLVDGA